MYCKPVGDSVTRVVIRPAISHSITDNLRDVWSSRHIAWSLALREIQIRYKQSFIGVAWTVLQPLMMTAVFTVIFGLLAKIPTDGVPYPIFVLSGSLFWQYFSRVVVDSSASLVKNEAIITKVFFPRLILPLVPALSAAVDLGVSLSILLLMMLFYGITPTAWLLLLAPSLLTIGLLGFGVGLMLSPVNALYRDITIALPFFVQLAMYLTPVIYPVSLVPNDFQWIFMFNPIATLIDTARATLLSGPFPSLPAYGIVTLWVVLVFVLGFRVFRKLEPAIADRI